MRHAFSIAILACLFWARPSLGAVVYDNVDYGVHGEAPDGKVICRPSSDTANHGFYIRLDAPVASIDCDADPAGAVITVFFAYNVAYEATSTGQLAAHVCDRGGYKPSPYRTDGVKFVQCFSEKEAKISKVEYVVLRPGRRRLNTPEIELDVTLACPAKDCASYSRYLKQTIERLRSRPVVTQGAP